MQIDTGIRAIVILLLLSGIVACTDLEQSDLKQECPLILDQTSIIDEKKHEGVTYYLVKRISGWHDKTIIIELFDKKPSYDNCNRNKFPPIIDDSIATDMSIESLEINLIKKQFEIKYSDTNKSGRIVPTILDFK